MKSQWPVKAAEKHYMRDCSNSRLRKQIDPAINELAEIIRHYDPTHKTISTLNAIGYDGEACVRELPEIMKRLESVDNWYSGSLDNQPAYVASLRFILAKCKAK